jgi:hypothetical protein
MSPVKGDKKSGEETIMKLTGLTSLLAALSVVGNLSFSPAYLRAAEKAKETEGHHPTGDGFSGYDSHHRCGRG